MIFPTAIWLCLNSDHHSRLEIAINSKLMSRNLICCSHLPRPISGPLKQHLVVTLAFKWVIIYIPLLCWFLICSIQLYWLLEERKKSYWDKEKFYWKPDVVLLEYRQRRGPFAFELKCLMLMQTLNVCSSNQISLWPLVHALAIPLGSPIRH